MNCIFFKYSYIFYIYVLFGFDGFFIWYIIIVMYFTNFFVCFVFKVILLCLHATLCVMTLEVINHKNMANFVIVFDVKIMYMILSSNPASFMNFGKKLGWPSSLLKLEMNWHITLIVIFSSIFWTEVGHYDDGSFPLQIIERYIV